MRMTISKPSSQVFNSKANPEHKPGKTGVFGIYYCDHINLPWPLIILDYNVLSDKINPKKKATLKLLSLLPLRQNPKDLNLAMRLDLSHT